MTKQTIVRIALVLLVLAAGAFVLITCSNNGAPAADSTQTEPVGTETAGTETAGSTTAGSNAAGSDTPEADTPEADTPEADTPKADTPEADTPEAETADADAETAGAGAAGSAAGTGADTGAETAAAGADTGTEASGAGEGEAAALPFVVDQAASEARFVINETLLGMPTEVVGVTNLISGTLAIDPADPANTTVGVITIDARSLETDRDLRDRAIRRFILESNKDEFRYITFTPATITGLPAAAAPGDTLAFAIAGDLQIKDVVQPVTFAVELTVDSATKVSGVATATVLRSDFDLQIPSAPGVADVTDEVRLELAFAATAE